MIRPLILATLLLLLGYGLIEARPLLLGPSLSLSSPTPYATSTDGSVTVAGHESRAVALLLNGNPVLPDQDGTFSSTLTLPRGGSILTLAATDRFGRSVTITRTVYVP